MQIMLETGQFFIVDVSTVATIGEAALRTGGFSDQERAANIGRFTSLTLMAIIPRL